MKAWLENAEGAKTPVANTLSLGRSAKNTLKLNHELASRHHALIHSQGFGEYWLVDLGSTNGTMHRGRRIWQPVPLADGDSIEICGLEFIFRKADAHSENEDTEATRVGGQREVRTHRIWMLLADIEQSSSLSQQYTPEKFATMVGSWFRACKEAIETHSGLINKYLGDGLLAYWDPRVQSPAEVLKTIAKLKIQRDTQAPLFRIVLHRGEVAMSDGFVVGEDSLLGEDMHFLFKTEKVAGAAGWPMVISSTAAKEIEALHPTVILGEREVPGFKGLHTFHTMDAETLAKV